MYVDLHLKNGVIIRFDTLIEISKGEILGFQCVESIFKDNYQERGKILKSFWIAEGEE